VPTNSNGLLRERHFLLVGMMRWSLDNVCICS